MELDMPARQKLTPANRVLIEKQTVSQPVKNVPVFYENHRSIKPVALCDNPQHAHF